MLPWKDASASDRSRERHERRKEQGLPPSRGRKQSLFDDGEFVAVDGEGFSEGAELSMRVGAKQTEYSGKRHYYGLLAASDGSELYTPVGRLETKACLDFLLDIKKNNSRAILVCFGGSYDVIQMLAHGLTREQIRELTIGGNNLSAAKRDGRKCVDISLGEHDYRLEYRARKAFSIWRWPRGADKHEQRDNGTWKLTPCDKVTMWDVWGFFQDSFKGVLKKWVPNDPDYQFIAKMKDDRAIFERHQIEEIRRYTQAELRCLVALMELVRDAMKALDLKLARWDGAGAIAASMMQHHKVRDHKAKSPIEVFDAARSAYSGGHIEICKLGYHNGPVYHYDVNSAYPHQFRSLPSLASGSWSKGSGADYVPAGFTLVKVAYRFLNDMPFYPLFFREENGTIVYPPRGTGWYWYPEYEAAREYAARLGAVEFTVLQWHHFKPHNNMSPFHWVLPYYERRQELTRESKSTGIPNGEEKVIKLGLNSCYGKAAQQVGARVVDGEIQEPPYFQLEWAGYVTAGCRAQLMQAAIQKPRAIIAFATDGIFSTEPLDLYCPKEKELGAWEFKEHAGMTIVMPGVYWLHEKDEAPKHYSRGFDKRELNNVEIVHRAWQQRKDALPIKVQRLVGLSAAAISADMWKMRGMFVTSKRQLSMTGGNTKRYPVMLYKSQPHKGLVDTAPRDLWCDELAPLSELESAPYVVDWQVAEPSRDYAEEADIAAAMLA